MKRQRKMPNIDEVIAIHTLFVRLSSVRNTRDIHDGDRERLIINVSAMALIHAALYFRRRRDFR